MRYGRETPSFFLFRLPTYNIAILYHCYSMYTRTFDLSFFAAQIWRNSSERKSPIKYFEIARVFVKFTITMCRHREERKKKEEEERRREESIF